MASLLPTVALSSPQSEHTHAGVRAEAGSTVEGAGATADGAVQPLPFSFATLPCQPYGQYSVRSSAASACLPSRRTSLQGCRRR